ncbi:MAG TPA: hypothetical protein PK142_01490 [bacterium]|nr:hypothetical protein [bacterium]
MIDKKSQKELETLTPDPVFNIHRMPQNYKSGRFEVSSDSGETKIAPTKEHKQKNKKIGLVIMIFGFIFVAFLGYLIFSYISNPNFSFNSLFSFNNENKTDNIINNTNNNSADLAEEKQEENVIVDVVEENNQTESIVEDIEKIEENNTEEAISYVFLDSDSDGLSDEEEYVLGSNYLQVDSDNDGYNDLSEVLSLYNPIGVNKLVDNINIDEFKNNSFNYSLLYPGAWDKSILSDESSVIFSIDDNSFFQVLVEKNEGQQNIGSWYGSRFFSFINSEDIIIKEDWSGLYSEDGSAFYLTDKNLKNIYTILYNFSENQPQSYINILKMMVNSFRLN